MKANIKLRLIFCQVCNKWLNAEREIWLPDGMEGRVCCEIDDSIVGFTSDLEWNLLFPIIKIENQEKWDV